MKWTITDLMYAFFASVLLTGIAYEVSLIWIGNALLAADIILIATALMKYLNGDHLS